MTLFAEPQGRMSTPVWASNGTGASRSASRVRPRACGGQAVAVFSTVMVLALGLAACAHPLAESALPGGAIDDSAQHAASSTESTAGSEVLYSEVAPQFRDDANREYGQLVEDAAAAQALVAFSVAVPQETFGRALLEVRVLGDNTTEGGSSLVLYYDGIQIHEEVAAAVTTAQQRVVSIGSHGLPSFDERFMSHVSVGGNAGIAWDAADVPAETDGYGRFLPGIRILHAGVVWSQGSQVFTVLSSELDAGQLQVVANSMQ